MLIRKFYQDRGSWTKIEDGTKNCEITVYSDNETGELRVKVDGDRELLQDYVGSRGLHLFVEEIRKHRKIR